MMCICFNNVISLCEQTFKVENETFCFKFVAIVDVHHIFDYHEIDILILFFRSFTRLRSKYLKLCIWLGEITYYVM